MRTVFLAGGIASGKSTVARMLRSRGAWLCDLDQVAREVVAPGSEALELICREFGDDLVDPETGSSAAPSWRPAPSTRRRTRPSSRR